MWVRSGEGEREGMEGNRKQINKNELKLKKEQRTAVDERDAENHQEAADSEREG